MPKNRILFLLITVCFLACLTTSAFANTSIEVKSETKDSTTIVDSKVKTAINEGSQLIPVIITFKSAVHFEKRLTSTLSREDRIKTLQEQADKCLASFLQQINLSTREYKRLWLVNAIALKATVSDITNSAKNPVVETIEYDNTVLLPPVTVKEASPKGDWTYGLKKLGIPQIREEFGFQGKGITVGVIDTGVDAKHKDLRRKVDEFKDFVYGMSKPYDSQGHGTHCCGTIVGGDKSGTAIGIAPKAKLVVGMVFASSGGAQSSWLLEAMQYMTDPDGKPSTDDAPSVVSNSWGGSGNHIIYLKAIKQWVALNIFPSFAAGNAGPGPKTVGAPASYLESFTTGATNFKDALAGFSSRGPVIWDGTKHIKPDICAPGEDIYSTYLRGNYVKMSGTSMACPHISGVVALIHEARPEILVSDVRMILEETALDFGITGKDNNFGAGRVNAYEAVKIAHTYGRLGGTVISNSAGDPLPGFIHIIENNMDIPVNSKGEFAKYLLPGTYNIIAKSYGYANSQPVKARLVSGRDTNLKFKLKASTNALFSGSLVDSKTGALINGRVRLLNTTEQPVETENGHFSFSAAQGTYSLQAGAFGYRTRIIKNVVISNSCPELTIKMTANPQVLLLDDDMDYEVETFYKESLDSLGISYDYISLDYTGFEKTGPLKIEDIISYKTVIWFTGENFMYTLMDSDKEVLTKYLKTGGGLILTGQNITEQYDDHTFFQTALKVSCTNFFCPVQDVTGFGIKFALTGGSDNQKAPDWYEALPGGEQIFTYADGKSAGVYAKTYVGKSAACGFGIESIALSERTKVIDALVKLVAPSKADVIKRVVYFDSEEQQKRWIELHGSKLASLNDFELNQLKVLAIEKKCRPLLKMLNNKSITDE